MLTDTRTIGFSYADIIIFAGIHLASGGPVKCRNLQASKEDKKLKNQEIKHRKRDHPLGMQAQIW